MKQHSLALAISVACAVNPAFAEQQNKEDQIERLVVVSSRIAMPMREIATSV